ncbi:LysR substrate-binding domain-containing protein [Cupriavidus sp. AU9028]|uniref:LysR substrate-binding domain-containing protein n=1 Tax=Cupriavidus sp. AU9028 TaxID=2871157 RepID=UPI001C93883A|nr:LysR substrate-binding domain-containing protein [Cupriavidus sp. AU9028]MBY4897924.1 LysR family transcriptional regulator [Cupriavidus sp. AU9028]
MQLKWIEDLLVLERTRSFSRAAELRHITQSALSRRIRSLEDWAGAQLVDRTIYPLALTSAGIRFCEAAGQACALLLDARAAARREQTLPGAAIDIAAGNTLSLTFLPSWLKLCRGRFGEFNARVVAANVLDAVVALSEGSCDLMLGYNHPQVPVSLDPDRFRSLTVGGDMLLPVSVPDAQGRPLWSLDAAVERPIPFLGYTASTTLGRMVDGILEQKRAHGRLVRCYEADMAMLLLKMAGEGNGVAWLPYSTAADALASGVLVRAGNASWCSTLEICAWRPMQSANPTLHALWQMLESGQAEAQREEARPHVRTAVAPMPATAR